MTVATEPRARERRYVSNEDETCRMFRSELMERMSHVHPAVPHLLYIPVISVMLFLAGQAGQGVAQIALLFVGGVLVWSLLEYVIHRFVFHPPQWVEDETRAVTASLTPGQAVIPALPTWRHRFYFLVHGVHHDYPNDSGRLVMPPSVSIPLALVFFFLFQWAIGPLTPAAFAGLVSGYLIYDTTHYLTHHSSGKTAVGRYQKKRHFRHHYYDSTRNFGVSSPLWDVLWGTMGRTGR
ncbi:MAG: sterol desaturase family protein [Gemmatimonadota bacterium]|nr:sterol desaturase family protein [Gemmatimonadota bacterium]MDH5196782.1 sterol desaturase family protein [Gemmatimonadota bacterium]